MDDMIPALPRSVATPVTRRWSVRFTRTVLLLVTVSIALPFAFPYYSMLVLSFMPRSSIMQPVLHLWPAPWIWENYRRIFFGEWVLSVSIFRALFNSFVLATGQTIPMLLICSLLAFLFAKWDFPGRSTLFGLSLATMFIPYQATLVAFYLLVSRLGWLDTFLPLWIPWWVPGFAIFFLRQYIASSIPDDLLDSALIDGAGLLRQYWSVILPLIVPGLVVVGVLNFVNAWNDYIYSNLVFSNVRLYPSTLYLYSFQGSRIAVPEYGMMTAASILSSLPIVIIFLAFQRQIISGLTRGAIR